MQIHKCVLLILVSWGMPVEPALAQHEHPASETKTETPETSQQPQPETSAEGSQHNEGPALPEGMSLDEVLDYASGPPPESYPDPVADDELKFFTLFEQLEYRIPDGGGADQIGWEAQGWVGFDYNRFVWKSEGELTFEGQDQGESETDLLYSRLITPFWSLQAGAQYANEWESGDYEDRWSGVLALQGLAPGMIEMDSSLYISEDADVTAAVEAEYNLRLTQRLVLQPRAELGFAYQDIPDRALGAGLTDANLDLRLRYEIEREFAPYIGVRYGLLAGETASIAESAGADTESVSLIFGVRFAF